MITGEGLLIFEKPVKKNKANLPCTEDSRGGHGVERVEREQEGLGLQTAACCLNVGEQRSLLCWV